MRQASTLARVIEVTWTNNRGPHKGRDHSCQPHGRIRTMADICFLHIPTYALVSFARTCTFRAFQCFEASSSDLRSRCAGLLTASVCPGTASVHAMAPTIATPDIFA